MKIGSLVECIDNSFYLYPPQKNKPYTVKLILLRGLNQYNGHKFILPFDLIWLDEISQPMAPGSELNLEPGYFLKDFRELMPPMTKEIEELLKQPEYATI